jgi:ligand-binding SRPBCC domain-containing protein
MHLGMTEFRLETVIEAPIDVVFDLARDIGLHERSMASTGERAIAGRMSGPIEQGETVTWRARHFGLWWTMTSRITEVRAPTTFADQQEGGPFAWFRHRHTFRAVPGGTVMTDDWEHAAPFGPLGRVVDRLVLGRYMRRLLETRNAALKAEAERGAPQCRLAAATTASTVAKSGMDESIATVHEAIVSTPPGVLNE